MNCRGDDDIDANRSRPSIGKTRYVPREERTRAIVWNPISGLHQGQRPKRPHSKAEYMAAPERFAERSDFSLAPRAPSIHVWDPISGLHQGQRPKRPHSKAEYMAAPERFAERSDFSLAPRAPSIHGT